MNFFKNIVVSIIVLAISAGIFSLLIKEQDANNNKVLSAIKLFGDDLLAMVPEGEQWDALSQKLEDYNSKAENSEISQDQVQVTLARGLNMQMGPQKPSPEEWNALLDASLDPDQQQRVRQWRAERHSERSKQYEVQADQLARNYHEMVALRKEIERVCQEDTACQVFYQSTMFVADQGLRLVVDSNIDRTHILEHHPEMRRRLEKMSDHDLVTFENFAHVPEVVQQGLIHFAPMIPQSIRAEIAANAEMNIDTLAFHITQAVLNPDSLSGFIQQIIQIVEEFE